MRRTFIRFASIDPILFATLFAAFLVLHTGISRAVDTNMPYWNAINSPRDINGDGPLLGLITAKNSLEDARGYIADSCRLSSPSRGICIWTSSGGINWDGRSSLVCKPYSKYIEVSGYCIPSGGVNQPPGRCNPKEGNPVIIGTGTKSETAADYASEGARPLDFVREYFGNRTVTYPIGASSARRIDTSRLGLAWRSKYDSALAFTSATPAAPADKDRAHLLMPSGHEIAFIYSASLAKWRPGYFNWVAFSGVDWRAPRTDIDIAFDIVGSEALVTYANGDVWAYELNGLLKEIRYKSGYSQTLAYTGINNTSITDNLGRSLQFAYDSLGLMTSMTAPDGKVYKYTYLNPVDTPHEDLNYMLKEVILPDSTPLVDTDNPRVTYHYENPNFLHALTGITDERGVRYATWTYDNRGRVLTSSHAGGADTYGFAYDDVNNTRTVTNPLGKQTIYHFQMVQGRQRITQVEGVSSANCAASDTSYAYDTAGFVNQTTDGEGRITKYTNNSRGLPLTIVEGFGTPEARTTTLTWHASLNKPTQIVEPRLTTDLVYDTAGNLSSLTQTDTTPHTLPYATSGQTRAWTYTYSPQGLLLAADGPLAGTGDTVTYAYDANGFVDTITNEMGHVTQVMAKNANGQPLTVRDANGVDTVMTYDDRNRLATVTVNPGPAQAVTSFTYDANSNITRITRPNGAYLDYTYSDARRVTVIADNTGSKIELGYDAMGNVTSRGIKDPANTVTFAQTQVFDELGRLMQSIGASSQTTLFTYDKTDDLKTVTDPRSNVYSYAYDALSRLIQETTEDTSTISYGLDGRDGLSTYTDPRSLVTSYVRNGFGEAIQEASPDAGTTVYVRDARGLITQMTDGRGIVTNFVYDNLGRETSRSFPSAAGETITWTWDSVASGNKGVGHLTSLSDQSGSMAFIHDARGNVVSDTHVIGANSYPVSYEYDAADSISQITYPSGRQVTITRNALGQVSTITTKKDAVSPVETVVSGVGYSPMSEFVTGFAYGNGLTYEAQLTLDHWLDALRLKDGASTVMAHSYGYTDDLNLTDIADDVTPAESQSFWYSATRRLQNASSSYGDYTYYHDGVGNRTYEILDQGGTTTTRNEGYPASSNRIAGVLTDGVLTRSFTHDNAGNIITDTQGSDVTAYGYNARNRLATVTKNGSLWATYQYNALEQLVSRTVTAPVGPTGTVQYIYDRQGQLIAEADAATGATLREYIWLDDMPVAVVSDVATSPVTYFVHVDHLKRPAAMSDATKAMVWQAKWLPFGAPQSITGTASLDARFPGQWFQIESGLHYNWHRHYDPSIGRYTQPDPLRFVDGMNMYGYVGGSPLMYIDRDGRYAWMIPYLAGAAIGIGLEYLLNECATWQDYLRAGAVGAAGGALGRFWYMPFRRLGWAFEKSHSLPARYFRPSSASFKPWLPRWLSNHPLNINMSTPWRHFKHDPFRFPTGYASWGRKLPNGLQQLDRSPDWLKGAVVGGAAGSYFDDGQ
ncbi:RHS repeat-associated core domain-containing protein [Taklimakanibacter lacteus]|uniref:RHS repeat-associated core domain-containing protein n=1 Tax=Taklimakanibacter lacteus TaxID=2268456 RepID=UPI000E671608